MLRSKTAAQTCLDGTRAWVLKLQAWRGGPIAAGRVGEFEVQVQADP